MKTFYWHEWPCCSGTYIQNMAEYHNMIYLKDAEGLYVNLYVPSEVDWSLDGQTVTLETGDRLSRIRDEHDDALARTAGDVSRSTSAFPAGRRARRSPSTESRSAMRGPSPAMGDDRARVALRRPRDDRDPDGSCARCRSTASIPIAPPSRTGRSCLRRTRPAAAGPSRWRATTELHDAAGQGRAVASLPPDQHGARAAYPLPAAAL